MEFIGAFSHVGRPIDSIRFEVINGNQIKYQSIGTEAIQMPIQSIIKVNQDPHPDYFKTLDKLVPFAIEVLDLGKRLTQGAKPSECKFLAFNSWRIVSA